MKVFTGYPEIVVYSFQMVCEPRKQISLHVIKISLFQTNG